MCLIKEMTILKENIKNIFIKLRSKLIFGYISKIHVSKIFFFLHLFLED